MNQLKKIHLIGVVFTIIIGSLLHFTWEWSGQNEIIAIFSAVSESVWEHLKLLFFPYLFFLVIEYFLYGNDQKCFFSIKLRSVLLGMFFMISGFYTYSGILGHNYLILDIILFMLSVILSYYDSYRKLSQSSLSCSKTQEFISFSFIIILILIFAYISFYPPSLALFISSH